MNIRLNIEKRTILILALFSITTVAIVLIIIFPTIGYIKSLTTQTDDLRQYLEKKYETNHILLNSRQKIEETKRIIADYDNYLFFKEDDLKLITELESLAARYQITQKIESPDLGQTNVDTIHISLTLSGNYQNLLEYLNVLEKQNYFLKIKNLQFSSGFSSANNNQQAATLNLEIILYVAKH